MPKKIFFTPGPSALYFTVEEHLKQAMRDQVMEINHRSSQAEDYFRTAVDNLKSLMSIPEDYSIFFLSSATEIWERQLQNLVVENSFHYTFGAFSNRFFNFAVTNGFSAKQESANFGELPNTSPDLIPNDTELIGVTLNETSTGVSFPVEDIYKIRAQHPEKLIAVDGVSAFPSIDLDFSKIDSAYFSVQKCFGLPAGLGVWVVSPKAMAAAEAKLKSGRTIGTYQALPNLFKNAQKAQTTFTANVLGIYLLSKVSADMLEKGIDVIRRETSYKAALLNHMVDSHPNLEHFVSDRSVRSKTVTVANTVGDSNEILNKLSKKGFVLGNGYGEYKGKQIRIASFPTHSKEQMELLVDVINDII
ncbi:aminotransferase class V-fold PLP-dependent enzyme [Roseivirga misakiensis]|uniref:phosphoserine transaminase n=1 Tax=Roseivirga misakiensis TaxID=1563681 RepID=A0A1E5T1I8_9BACT|nr:aminotransferase class V-fold PLP-dependent enzyme [Roseivirga misakiensis]OEK05242.1 phosphoserine aminotransferase [Roseivirga misakiensis]